MGDSLFVGDRLICPMTDVIIEQTIIHPTGTWSTNYGYTSTYNGLLDNIDGDKVVDQPIPDPYNHSSLWRKVTLDGRFIGNLSEDDVLHFSGDACTVLKHSTNQKMPLRSYRRKRNRK